MLMDGVVLGQCVQSWLFRLYRPAAPPTVRENRVLHIPAGFFDSSFCCTIFGSAASCVFSTSTSTHTQTRTHTYTQTHTLSSSCPSHLLCSNIHREEEEDLRHYQFIMELRFSVIKKTWLLPPERTEAKNTCRDDNCGFSFNKRLWRCIKLNATQGFLQLRLYVVDANHPFV